MQSMVVHIDIVMILPSGGLIPTPFSWKTSESPPISGRYCHKNETLPNSIHNTRVFITTKFASTFPTQGIPSITVYDSHPFWPPKWSHQISNQVTHWEDRPLCKIFEEPPAPRALLRLLRWSNRQAPGLTESTTQGAGDEDHAIVALGLQLLLERRDDQNDAKIFEKGNTWQTKQHNCLGIYVQFEVGVSVCFFLHPRSLTLAPEKLPSQ